jgi:hypothetical protein
VKKKRRQEERKKHQTDKNARRTFDRLPVPDRGIPADQAGSINPRLRVGSDLTKTARERKKRLPGETQSGPLTHGLSS